MEQNSTKTQADGTMLFAGEAWFNPIEAGIRAWMPLCGISLRRIALQWCGGLSKSCWSRS
jgi:hypothetical protein